MASRTFPPRHRRTGSKKIRTAVSHRHPTRPVEFGCDFPFHGATSHETYQEITMKPYVQWLGAAARHLFTSLAPTRREVARALRVRPGVERLEDRRLPATFTLNQVLTTFNQGAAALRAQASAITNQAFSLDLPVAQQNLAEALSISQKLNSAFN